MSGCLFVFWGDFAGECKHGSIYMKRPHSRGEIKAFFFSNWNTYNYCISSLSRQG